MTYCGPDPNIDLVGPFDIEFMAGPERHVNVAKVIVNHLSHILWLEDENGVIYNWNTIIKMKRCK